MKNRPTWYRLFLPGDAIVMTLRHRQWPEAAMKHFADAVARGVIEPGAEKDPILREVGEIFAS